MIRQVTFGFLISMMSSCYAPPSKAFGAGGILTYTVFGSVRPWVSLRVCLLRPENFVNTISQKANDENFTQFWSLLGFIDVLIRFWGQKVKGQGVFKVTVFNRVIACRGNDPVEYSIFVTTTAKNFCQNKVTYVPGSANIGAYWLGLPVKRSKVKGQGHSSPSSSI